MRREKNPGEGMAVRRVALACVATAATIATAMVAGELFLRWCSNRRAAVTYEGTVRGAAGENGRFSAIGNETPPTAPVTNGRPAPVYARIARSEMFRHDPVRGFTIRSNCVASVTKRVGTNVIYQAAYTIDGFSRRAIPVTRSELPSDRCVIFFGGSYAFGEGVDDDETLPARVAARAGRWRVYNYGRPGYGPQHMLDELSSELLSRAVKERRAKAVYIFLHEHINRTVGTPRVAGRFGRRFPWYEYDRETDVLSRKGSFADRPGRPAAPSSVELVDYFRDFHGELTSRDDAGLATRVIEEAKKLFEQRFDSQGFYVLLFPGRQGGHTDYVAEHLRASGVAVLDYRDVLKGDVDHDDFFFPHDGHPKPAAYGVLADRLFTDLGCAD